MSAESKLKEAFRHLNNCEEYLYPRIEDEKKKNKELGFESGDVILEIVYEKIVKARDLIIEAME